jgi:pimeloyl-ACP methyl ester carboxylesterase
MKKLFPLVILLTFLLNTVYAQIAYPADVKSLSIVMENKNVKIAYMDVAAPKPNGKSILLLHGKNFNGSYWKDLLPFLTGLGYRVIMPDQPGWGLSDKPDLHYSFHALATATAELLDSLKVEKTILLGHSMGGMLAIRFSLLFPDRVEKMILEDPIGLEDYRTFVPYRSIQQVYEQERKATYDSYKKYQQGYYPEWKPEYEQYVRDQAAALKDPHFDKIAWVNALTYDMIYQQPVVYELGDIKVSVLLVTGEADNTIVGKDQLSDSVKTMHGHYPELGRHAAQVIKKCTWFQLMGIGHIPHIQDPEQFEKAIGGFLR